MARTLPCWYYAVSHRRHSPRVGVLHWCSQVKESQAAFHGEAGQVCVDAVVAAVVAAAVVGALIVGCKPCIQ